MDIINTNRNYPLYLQFFIAGFTALAYQIVSFKLISSSGIGDAISVAISLTAFVSLSGIGSLLGGRIKPSLTGLLEIILGAYSITLFGSILLFGIDGFTAFTGHLSLQLKLLAFLFVVSPLAIISGMLIPLHQYRTPQKSNSKNDDFLRFFFVYVLFHFGGGLSLLFIEFHSFPAIGWLQTGIALGILSVLNGITIIMTPNAFPNIFNISTPVVPAKEKQKPYLLFGLFILSIITGYVGIISYKIFDYLVEPNVRNYTVVTALIFFGLGLSGIISKKVKLSFRGILGMTGLGILSMFISIVLIPPLANILIKAGASHWWIYGTAGCLLIIPVYSLIGVSIPSAIRLGVRSEYALFIVSIGNALGYWVYILTAHYNIDTIVLFATIFLLAIFSTKKLIVIIFVLAIFLLSPLFKIYEPATHQMTLHNYVLHKQKILDDFWSLHYPYDDMDLPMSNELTYEFDILKSWNTYGWGVDHVQIKAFNQNGNEFYNDQFFKVGGSKSLSLNPFDITVFFETMVASLPAFYVDDKNRGLVLGSGSGISANLVGKTFNYTDLIDISPDTLSQLDYFNDLNDNVADDVNLIKQDALSFLMDSETSKEPYDFIFSTVTSSGYPMSSLLYTQEFFESTKKSLVDGGVFGFWMDRRFGKKAGSPEIIQALNKVFPYVETYRVSKKDIYLEEEFIPYISVVASNRPLEISTSNKKIINILSDKYDVLDHYAYDMNEDLSSTKIILEKREINDIFNNEVDKVAGINSMSYSYSALLRYEIISKIWNSKEN